MRFVRSTMVLLCAGVLAAASVSVGHSQNAPIGPVRISGGVMAGQILNKVNPQYPAEAKQSGVEGVVVLHAVIGTDGTVENLQAVSGPDLLIPAAMDAVRQWTYKPYLLNGQPTEVDTTITVNFSLSPGPA